MGPDGPQGPDGQGGRKGVPGLDVSRGLWASFSSVTISQ